MYYLQNTQSINTVILSFDGVMTGLSKLRYNYYRRFCKLYDKQLDTDLYYNQCASSKTMYDHCPIPSNLISKETLMHKVEEDLYAYSLNHGIKIHEGFDELYELLKSKRMRLIYTSTHPKKYSEPLFVLTGSIYRPHQFSYDDISIYEQYKDRPSEVLVIASDIETLKLANKYRYNVVYYPTVQDENDEITIRSLSVIHHLIEAINLVLDKSRQPRHKYLLIDENTTLDDAYHRLLETSNSSLHQALTAIYNEEVKTQTSMPVSEEIADEFIEEEIIEDTPTISEETINEESLIEENEDQTIDDSTTETNQLPFIEESEDLFEKTMVFNIDEISEEDEEENFTFDSLESDHEDTHTDIDSILDELNKRDQEINHTKIFTNEELKEFGMSENDLYHDDDDDDQKEPLYKIICSSFLYAVVDSIIFLLIYLAMSIGLYDWIFKKDGMLSFIQPIIKAIHNISMNIFGGMANSIGEMINASTTLVEGIAVFSFIVVIWWIGFIIVEVIKNNRK